MFTWSTRRNARRRALALASTLLLVWCQVAAVVHATSFAVAGIALEQSAAEMAEMVGCDGMPDADAAGGTDCPTEHATSDAGKLPVVAPLLAGLPFAPANSHQTGLAGPHRYEWPQGRAPPRSRLCSWII